MDGVFSVLGDCLSDPVQLYSQFVAPVVVVGTPNLV